MYPHELGSLVLFLFYFNLRFCMKVYSVKFVSKHVIWILHGHSLLMMYRIWFYGNFCFLPKILHGSIDYQSCSQSKILDSAWPQLFNDVSNLTLWYILPLTLDFAWKFNLSNFLQVSNFGIYMTRSFQWSTTLAYTCFYIVLNFIFWRGLFAPPLIALYI